ncbi:MAG: carboxypeptidase-like regulatory domain-containing protein [Bacteroidia bacterium]
MTNEEAGRYCSNCQKTVTDFTRLSREEIIQKVTRAQTGLCARVLKKEMEPPPEWQHNPTTRNGFAFAASLLMLGALFTGAIPVTNKSVLIPVPSKGMEQGVQRNDTPETPGISDSTKVIVRGKLIDSLSNEPLGYGNVFIKGSQIGTMTDSSGNFTLEVPFSYQGKDLVLVCTYIGYVSREMIIKQENLHEPQLLIMSESNVIMGAMICTFKAPRKKAWQFWK